MKKWLRLAAVVALCASPGWAVDWKTLQRQGFVSDYAGVVDPRTRQEIEEYCAQVEQATGVRMSFLTIPSLEGEPLDDVGSTIFRAWGEANGIPPQKDQRVMLIVSVNDRHDWVGTSAGLNPELTRSVPSRVHREAHVALRQKEYGEALVAAAETIGEGAAQVRHVPLRAHLQRRIHWSPYDAIPWVAVGGGLVIVLVLMWIGNPAGYGGFGGRGLLPALFRRETMSRSTWGSRGAGGFGGFDSGDSSGGFGGGCCRDW